MPKTSIAGIAVHGRKVLIAHRNPVGQMGGRWEFPGGKVEEGETDFQAIVREFGEEFGIKVRPGSMIAKAVFEHNGENLLHAYTVRVPHRGIFFKYRLTEHTEYRWADIDEIASLDFVDSDLLIYPDVKKFVLDGGR
ncbi:MAG: NUDIX domain-containing protein [Treponema sp.]|nr:NUDIX domain-containing protein [Treponema sp.]MBR6193485.1 NUDIX domain-containing protein [Treponema sp.]